MELFRLFGTIAVNNNQANRAIDDTTDQAENAESKMTAAFKKIGAAVAAYFAIDKIKDFGTEIVNTAAEVSAEASAFEQIMGDYSDQASEKVAKIADATGMVDTRLTPYMTSMTAKFKGLGYDVEDATDLASTGLNIAADAAAFWDKSLDDSMGALNSFVNGSYEGGESIGLFANETTLASWAAQNLGQDWKSLSEKEKQFTRLQFAKAMQEASGAAGQAAKESEQYANVQANLAEKWRQFKAEIGEPLLQNVVLPSLQRMTVLVDKLSTGFQAASKWISENKDKIKQWTAIIASASVGVSTFLILINWGSIMTAASKYLGLVTSGIKAMNIALASNPIALIISILAALASYLIYLYNTNEDFRNKVNAAWDSIKQKLQPFFEWFKSTAIPAIENVATAIGNFISWILPYIETAIKWIISLFQSGSDQVGGIFETIKNIFLTAWDFIKSVWEACLPFFQAVWDGIIAPLGELFSEIFGAFKMAWDVIVLIWEACLPFFQAVWDGIKFIFSAVKTVLGTFFKVAWDAIKFIWDMAKPYFAFVWNNIKAIFSVVAAVLGGFFRAAWETIKAVWDVAIKFFTLIWAGIKAVFAVVKGVLSGDFSDAWGAIKNVWNRAKEFFQAVWDGIKGIFGAVASYFKGVFSAAWNAIKSVFSGVGTFFAGIWNTIKSTFTSIGTKIGDAIGGAFKAAINGVISLVEGAINKIPQAINGAIGAINKLPGVSISRMSTISLPRLAKGGIVDKSTIANIGENGAEAIVPLERNTEWLDKLASKINSKTDTEDISPVIIVKLNELIEEIKNLKIYLDSGVLVGELAPAMDSELGSINRLRERGR